MKKASADGEDPFDGRKGSDLTARLNGKVNVMIADYGMQNVFVASTSACRPFLYWQTCQHLPVPFVYTEHRWRTLRWYFSPPPPCLLLLSRSAKQTRCLKQIEIGGYLSHQPYIPDVVLAVAAHLQDGSTSGHFHAEVTAAAAAAAKGFVAVVC